MNKKQKAAIDALATPLENAQGEMQTVVDDLQESFDAKSEKWQESEKGQTAQEQIDALQAATTDLDNVIQALAGLVGD